MRLELLRGTGITLSMHLSDEVVEAPGRLCRISWDRAICGEALYCWAGRAKGAHPIDEDSVVT